MKPIIAMSVGLVMALAAGCAGAPKEDSALEKARAEYRQLSSDPQVQAAAPRVLLDIESTLQAADSAVKPQVRDHHLYIANSQMELARTLAQREVVQSDIESLAQERDQLQITARQSELEQAQGRTQELEAELAALEARRTDRGMIITLGDVLFDTGQASIKPGAQDTLDKLAEFLKAHPEQSMVVEGHTDSIGPESLNQQLSQQRAESVKSAITARGVESDRIDTRGYGESRPIASNDNPGGRQLNRRVEIVLPSS